MENRTGCIFTRVFIFCKALYSEILVAGTSEIIEVIETLKSAGIDSGASDILGYVYQG